MFKLMKKIPGGTLLVPMMISALVNTIDTNNVLEQLGGPTRAFFTGDGINYVVAAVCLISGTTIEISHLKDILKKQGSLILVKTIVCVTLSLLFVSLFGVQGIWGVAAVTLVAVMTSTNPALYLSLENEFGTADDCGAFGLMGLICVPAYPLLVYGVSQQTPINWTPIISTLIPIVLGVIIGNTDKGLKELFKPGLIIFTPLMGWVFGANINIIGAVEAGFIGIALTVIYYIVNIPILYFVERKFLKADGISSFTMSSVAGLAVSVPGIAAQTIPALEPYVASASAQIALVVILTSLITPVITQKLAVYNDKKGINHYESISH